MDRKNTYIANQLFSYNPKSIIGFLTEKEGESMYCIENYNSMNPFFMSIVSSSDLWMFISSSGSLTAGRRNYNNAMFPYETDDKIHQGAEITGPKTIIRILQNEKIKLWEPFSDKYFGLYELSRNLYKNTSGNKIIFEEINHDLQLIFSYSWMSSEKLGWIRKANLQNVSEKKVEIDLIDGLQNVLPFGIIRESQSMMSTLMDAYKVAELIHPSNLALFRMSSIPVDRAEPSEALKTNCIWSYGLEVKETLLSSKQINGFRFGNSLETEKHLIGERTSYFINSQFDLKADEKRSWFLIADVAKDSSDIISLQNELKNQKELGQYISENILDSTNQLNNLVALADGIQKTGDPLNDKRHYANVMFNIMRGGIFENNYEIKIEDFKLHLEQCNKIIYNQFSRKINEIDSPVRIQNLINKIEEIGDANLIRLTYEYLPISFSRRHGDPSRPWNYFDINIKNSDGSPSLDYQGNWRDIFQNWETLGFSFPEFIPNMIFRFLNASTADGYNPYRITRNGFDWEVLEPDNPWAYIGYWGDHQIIYMLKFLESFEKFYPGQLLGKFNQSVFAYANVPYRIKNYQDILAHPQDTISFDWDLHNHLMQKYEEIGSDGKLLTLSDQQIHQVSFIEKTLISLLTKLSNFVPDAGIWLNTQRPEWNDANNALVGNGASMVTLFHLRRYVQFFVNQLSESSNQSFKLSAEVNEFFNVLFDAFKTYSSKLDKGIDNHIRKEIVDELGKAGSDYRNKIYSGFSGKFLELKASDLLNFYHLVLKYIDHSIVNNKRKDNLFHSYNLLEFSSNSIEVKNLDLMVEGQVAILNSGFLDVQETLELIKALFKSGLWREDQQSFLLYPFKVLPDFLSKNIIPAELVKQSKLLLKLISDGNNQIIKQDVEGSYHFNFEMKNAGVLIDALHKLPVHIDQKLIEEEKNLICTIYESVFNHRAFTGRSGSFYKYEGLGSIYWHMISKLLLAVGDNIIYFSKNGAPDNYIKELKSYYYRIKEGIGVHKNPKQYGAFPTDPYSHTPSMMGAQQPGMTGQVKEDILSRFNELGLVVENGEIKINPILIQNMDFSADQETKLEFTYCGTPFVYLKSDKKFIEIYKSRDLDLPIRIEAYTIPQNISKEIFNRNKTISRVIVYV